MYFCKFIIISHRKRPWPFIWTNMNPRHSKAGWYLPSGSGEDFKISSTYFRYFNFISFWKETRPFIWRNLNPLHLRMLCAKFGWNWSNGSGEEDNNVKTTLTTDNNDNDDNDDNDGQRTNFDEKSSYDPLVQVSYVHINYVVWHCNLICQMIKILIENT